MSVLKNSDLSDKYYLFYEYTIENTTNEWKDVQVKSVYFDGQETEILTDDKLSSWIEGAELKLKAANYNRELLLSSIVAVGGVAALTSNNSNVQVVGAGAAVGAAAVGGAKDISRARQKAVTGMKGVNQTVNVPQSHIFVPSKVAPESYIKRWIVVRAPDVKKGSKTIRSGNNFYYSHSLVTVSTINNKDANFTTTVKTGYVTDEYGLEQ